jgi:hypothetical protein
MGLFRFFAILALGCLALAAQQPAASSVSPAAVIGFSDKLPPDWIVVDEQSPTQTPSTQTPSTQTRAQTDTQTQAQTQALASQPAKKGMACIEVLQTARHGDPASVITVVALPFDCFGRAITRQDLADLGSGAADGLKQAFDMQNPVVGNYSLGSHALWIERAKASPNGHNGIQYTVEIACSVLKNGAVCWMTTAADEASLLAFEQMPVELDGEAATPLVPATAFDKAPQAP